MSGTNKPISGIRKLVLSALIRKKYRSEFIQHIEEEFTKLQKADGLKIANAFLNKEIVSMLVERVTEHIVIEIIIKLFRVIFF